MIIIKKDTTTIYIPKHTSNLDIKLTVKLENNLTHGKFEYNLEDKDINGHFYIFDIPEDIKTKDEGEYTYNLFNGDILLEKGILCIGDYKVNNTEYNNDKKTVQYNGKK